MGLFGRSKQNEKAEQLLAEVTGGVAELQKQALAQMQATTGGMDVNALIQQASGIGPGPDRRPDRLPVIGSRRSPSAALKDARSFAQPAR